MAITVYTATATLAEVASGQSVTATVPTGTANGDVLCLVLAATTVPATVTGWTAGPAITGGSVGLAVFYRVAASEPASYTITGLNSAAAGRISAEMVRLTGVDTTAPVDAGATATFGTAAADSPPVVTTTAANDAVIYAIALNAASSADVTVASGTTLITDSTGTGRRCLTAYETQASAGGTTARSFAITGTQINGVGATIAFKGGTATSGAGSLALSGTGSLGLAGSSPGARSGSLTLGGTGTLAITGSSANTSGGRNAYVQPFASDSVWNTAIGSGAIYEAATDPATASLQKAGMYPYVNAAQYSIPITIASSTDPMVTVTTPYNGSFTHHMPDTAQVAGGTDGNLEVMDGQYVYDYWQAIKQTTTSYTAQAGRKEDLLGTGLGGGIRAAGWPSIAGLIRKEEFAAGVIPHALDLALDPTQLKRGYVWPAISEDAGNSYSGGVPIGTLVAIPPSVDVTTLGLTREGLMLAKALQDYGAYVSDQAGGGPILYAEPVMAGTQGLSNLTSDWSAKVCKLLRVVSNSTATTVGGGGSRRQPFAAAPYIPGTTVVSSATLVHRIVGISDPTACRVAVQVTRATSARLKLGTDPAVSAGIVYGPSATPDGSGYAQLTASGLTAGTRYYYRVEMTDTSGVVGVDTGTVGQLKTAPVGRASFAFNFGSCTDAADSASLAAIAARGDDLFFHLGDLYYNDNASTALPTFLAQMKAKVEAPNHAAVFATTPTSYTPSDHDGMTNDSTAGVDPTAWTNWNSAYRTVFPATSQIPATTGAYYTWTWGRVRFVQLDDRSFKSSTSEADGPTHTALGATQKQWLKDTITNATEPVIVILQSAPWIGPAVSSGTGIDGWPGFATERTELANFFAASGKNIAMLGGDMHALCADDGTNSPGGIAFFGAAPFNNATSIKGGPWSAGTYPTTAGATMQMYGRMVVTDTGTQVSLAFTGYTSDNVARLSMTKTFAAAAATSGSGALAISGVGGLSLAGSGQSSGSGAGSLDLSGSGQLTLSGSRTGAAGSGGGDLTLTASGYLGILAGFTRADLAGIGGGSFSASTTGTLTFTGSPPGSGNLDVTATGALTFTAARYVFRGPVVYDVRPIETTYPPNRLFGYLAYGQTVWRDSAGQWHAQYAPGAEALAGAQLIYTGGRGHPLTDDDRAALVAGGYGDYIALETIR